MPDAIIWEFDGVGRRDYDAVNEQLGIDYATANPAWPAGLLQHISAEKPGGLVVFEVWESKDVQERWLADHLTPALQAAGVTTPPTRVEWLEVITHASPGRGSASD
jgi:hypothetical protein